MKKIILLLAFLLGLSAFAQNFPGEEIGLLKGRTLKVLPKEESLQKFGFLYFYTDANLKKVYKKSEASTPYDVLVGKEFKVLSYEAYSTSRNVKYKLLLENPQTGKLYFDYDPTNSYHFHFEVIGGLVYPEGFFCGQVYEKDMRATNSPGRWYETPVTEGIQPTLCKHDRDNTFLVSINVPTSERYVSGILKRGYTITFDNGGTITRPDEQLKSKEGPTGKLVIGLITVISNTEDLKLLQENKIVKVKLHNYENTIANGFTLREYFKCLISRMTVTAPAATDDCSRIALVKGAPAGEKHYEMPAIDGIIIKKVVAGSLPDIYLGTVTVPSNTRSKGKGVSIIFNNGDFISYPDAEVLEKPLADGTYEYIAVFLINDQDVNYFTASGIKGTQVIKAAKVINKGADIQKMATCLINRK